MTKNSASADRQRLEAENQLTHTPLANLPELPSRSTDEMLHELRVHQIELEMQNEELRRTQIKLSELTPDVSPAEDEVLIARQALHAFRLRFQHPRTEQWIEAEAPFPADMRRVLEALRTHRPAR